MNICYNVGEFSTRFEKCNTKLKKEYLMKNIHTINSIMEKTSGYCGSFGTGYPFYVLDGNFDGDLPIIYEQFRYNNELCDEAKGIESWPCETCLAINGYNMPDLKRVCKPCPKVSDSLKPRKVINRLPDVDMWMICVDEKIEEAKNMLVDYFNSCDMHTSDVDPIRTFKDINDIVLSLEMGKMPDKMLPLDVHIIKYSEFSSLLSEMPMHLLSVIEKNEVPYLPIHPISLRKTWQYDDCAYNFVLDYLLSLTPFNFEDNLRSKLNNSREVICRHFTTDDLISILDSISPDSVKRRFKTEQLPKVYERRVDSWRK